ncbi:hypothetical protein BJ875DRAFT_547226 [Amylocarpus encephaloides]|uniref:Uncharacterized protein n=1 Tax=Amylocarpus encephaloides TaxID=45428 RepID=A0A9P8C0P6_9HELO|nr:hypothetical protein BJ875DRAFT_547226 [Amylocarpus encephaloides]
MQIRLRKVVNLILSYVAFGEFGQPYVAFEAKDQDVHSPRQNQLNKRKPTPRLRNQLGRKFEDSEGQDAARRSPYNTREYNGASNRHSSPGVWNEDEFGCLVDATFLNHGIGLNTGAFVTEIHRQTVYPKRRTIMFSASVDDGEGKTIRIFEGQRGITDMNRLLGELPINDLLDWQWETIEVELELAFGERGRFMVQQRVRGDVFLWDLSR